MTNVTKLIAYSLKLGLLALGQQIGQQKVTQFKSCLTDIVTHTLSTDALADNVEVKAIQLHC